MAKRHPTPRVLLRNWLIKKLDENAFPNTRWLDRENMTFQIPWKHISNCEFDEADAEIFKAWSVDSGFNKVSENYAAYKTRFRCAIIKSPYIKELKDASKLSDGSSSSYKVYQISGPNGKQASWPHGVHSKGRYVTRRHATNMLSTSLTGYEERDLTNFNDPTSSVTSEPALSEDEMAVQILTDTILGHDIELMPDWMMDTNGGYPNLDFSLEVDTPEMNSAQQEVIDDVDDVCEVDILYFGHVCATYRFAERCHLYGRSDPNAHEGEVLPRLEHMLKESVETQRVEAQEILNPKNLNGGLLLEYEKGNIWATRFCLVHIYYSNFFSESKTHKLTRRWRTLIFSHDEFRKLLSSFEKGKSKCPSNEVRLGFGKRLFFYDDKILPVSALVKSGRNQKSVKEALKENDAWAETLCISEGE